jgi:hypothetical protein
LLGTVCEVLLGDLGDQRCGEAVKGQVLAIFAGGLTWLPFLVGDEVLTPDHTSQVALGRQRAVQTRDLR